MRLAETSMTTLRRAWLCGDPIYSRARRSGWESESQSMSHRAPMTFALWIAADDTNTSPGFVSGLVVATSSN